MKQLTIRGISIDLPFFQEEVVLQPITSFGPAGSLVTHFEYGNACLRTLDMKNTRLTDGKIRSVQTEVTNVVGADVRRVELSNCELRSLRWAGGKISRTRFNACELVGAKFENVAMEHVIFSDCKMDYATLNQVRASGPVIFIRCSLREGELRRCDIARSLWNECNLTRANFGDGRYTGSDFRGNDLSVLRGVHHLRRVIIDRIQLVQLAEALATELEISFGDEVDSL